MEVDVTVLIFVESRYKVNRKRIKETVKKTLIANQVTTPCEVSIAIVGDRKMRALNKKYRNLDKTTNVLSFPLSEGEQTPIKSTKAHLGDIVLAYPQVVRDAAEYNVLVDDRVDLLVEHSMLHLLGVHHE